MIPYADANFLQMFLPKKFKTLNPQPNEFSSVERVVVLKPRGLRRPNVRLTTRKEINIEKNFEFHPYSHIPHGVSPMQFYEQEGGTVKLTLRDKISKKVYFLLAVVALALLPTKLETKGSVTSYNPQW